MKRTREIARCRAGGGELAPLCQDERVRLLGVIVLAIVATLAGLFGVMMLGLSGLTLAGPGLMIIEYSDSDDFERTIGIVALHERGCSRGLKPPASSRLLSM